MGSLELSFNDGNKDQLDHFFRKVFFNIRSDDSLKIEGMDDVVGRITWSGSYLYDRPYGMHDWVIRDRAGKIFGGIKYSKMSKGNVLIFEYDDENYREVLYLFYEVETEFLNYGYINFDVENNIDYQHKAFLNISQSMDKVSESKKVHPVEKASIPEKSDSIELDDIPDPDDHVQKYGTYRNMTKRDVSEHVRRCRSFLDKGGTIEAYYSTLADPMFAIDTLRGWMKDPRFN